MKCDKSLMRRTSPNENGLGSNLSLSGHVVHERSIDKTARLCRRGVNERERDGRQRPVTVDAIDRRDDFPQVIIGDAFPHL